VIDLEFCDMMMPLPWRPDEKSNPDQFFTQLWNWTLRSDTDEM